MPPITRSQQSATTGNNSNSQNNQNYNLTNNRMNNNYIENSNSVKFSGSVGSLKFAPLVLDKLESDLYSNRSRNDELNLDKVLKIANNYLTGTAFYWLNTTVNNMKQKIVGRRGSELFGHQNRQNEILFHITDADGNSNPVTRQLYNSFNHYQVSTAHIEYVATIFAEKFISTDHTSEIIRKMTNFKQSTILTDHILKFMELFKAANGTMTEFNACGIFRKTLTEGYQLLFHHIPLNNIEEILDLKSSDIEDSKLRPNGNAKRKRQNNKNNQKRCYNCGNTGHMQKDCPKRKNYPQCSICKKNNHKEEDCYFKDKQSTNKESNNKNSNKSFSKN